MVRPSQSFAINKTWRYEMRDIGKGFMTHLKWIAVVVGVVIVGLVVLLCL